MTRSTIGNYTSFLSEQISKTAANVSQAALSGYEKTHEYKKTIAGNYSFAKDKINKFVEAPEIQRIKNILEDSTSAVISANLLFDLGLLFVSRADSYYVALQCSKYLIACIIFSISVSKPHEMKKPPDINHENMGLYQSQIDEAYHVTSQLKDVFFRIETLLQESRGPSIKPSFVSSKDFETVKNNSAEVQPSRDVDVSMFIRSLLNGASKSVWIQYILKILSLSLSVSSSFNGIVILLALTHATVSALREDQLGAEDKKTLHLLKQQLDPIYATLQNLENKLSSSRDLKNHLNHEIKIPLNESNKDSGLDFFTMTERMAKTSGLYVVLHELFHQYKNFNFIICLAALQFTYYDLRLNKQKEEGFDALSKDFTDKMGGLTEMTEKMKQLLVKQENYEKFLIENNKAKEEYKKDIEIYKMEQLRKVDEERKLGDLREKELKEVFKKLEETWKENLKKLEETYQLQHPKNECIQPKLTLIKDEKDAMDSEAPVSKPAWLGGMIGAGIGWILGISISILCAAPTLGLSLIAPMVGALLGGIVGYLASRRAHSENSHTMFYKKETQIPSQIISTTATTSSCLHHGAGK